MNRWAHRAGWIAVGSCLLALGAIHAADDPRQPQEIRFGDVPDPLSTHGPFKVEVSATSGLPVALAVVDGPAALDGDILRLFGSPGIVLLRASQPGNGAFRPAPSLDRVITVKAPPSAPSFSTQPADRTAAVGETAQFTAEAKGDPAPEYQWRKDGQAIAGATGASLSFISVAKADAGAYDVVASNASGSATSSKATLTVGKRSQSILFTPPIGAYPVGQSVTLAATASSGLPVAFELVSGMGNLSGNVLTSTMAGIVMIRATQPGDLSYAAASPEQQSITFSPVALQHP